MTTTFETTAAERTTTKQATDRKDRRTLWAGLVGLVVGLILAGIAMGLVSLVVQSAPADEAAAPSVMSPEAIRARNFSGQLRADFFSPEAVRVRNAGETVKQDIFSPERYRVSVLTGNEPQEILSPERYRVGAPSGNQSGDEEILSPESFRVGALGADE